MLAILADKPVPNVGILPERRKKQNNSWVFSEIRTRGPKLHLAVSVF